MTLRIEQQSAEALSTLHRRLHVTGRAQLRGFLSEADARRLQRAAAEVEYNVVTRRATGHVDLPAAWLASLQPDQREGLGRAVQDEAVGAFQYLYDNHPLFDLWQADEISPIWAEVIAMVRSAEFLSLMRRLTGDRRIAMADAQLTRFRRAHFLTVHDDAVEGKNRLFAYVLSLTDGWKADWGGLLAFHDAQGDIAEAFTPRFNTLNLLKVPQRHSVTQVSLFAGGDRVSITGWLRTDA